MKKWTSLTLALFFLITGLLKAQQHKSTISGTVQGQEGEAIYPAYIFLKGTGIYTKTDEEGRFSLSVKPGNYVLVAFRVGYEKESKKITLKAGTRKDIQLVLEKNPDMTLDKLMVFGEAIPQEIRESAFSVSAVSASELHNTTMAVSQALDRISGVKIRKSGGLGSETSITLNGFSGRHVKVFIDGVPMRGYGPSFQIGNLPVSLVKRIEVYKGVVPIRLGSDALGGAINIVTNKRSGSYLDASYSYGSFNTHKSYINTGYTSESGFMVSVNFYQNYSDNNYEVDAKILDLETLVYQEGLREVRRFHDTYHNEALIIKTGLVDQSFADRLLVGLKLGQVYDEIQNPADMSFVYGQRFREASSIIPSLVYEKDNLFVRNLDVSFNAYMNIGEGMVIDTSRRRYNWLGEYKVSRRPGELGYSNYHYDSYNGAGRLTLRYHFLDNHTVTFSNSFTSFYRKGFNRAAPSPTDGHPNKMYKNVLGVSYAFKPGNRWSATFFLKHYAKHVQSYIDLQGLNNYANHEVTTYNTGYGIAATYFVTNNLQVKASYEQTYRLPTARELFGTVDGIIVGNIGLKPENSDNVNLGLNYHKAIDGTHFFNVSVNFIYRRTQDYIRRQIRTSVGTAGPINEGLVVNKGINTKLKYSYKNLFTIGAAFAYQDIRNKLKYEKNSTVVSLTYNDRVPNVPYMYGNAFASVFFDNTFLRGDRLVLRYSMDYLHEFYYDWPSYGGITIPTQLSHNLRLTYKLGNGRYNITLEARNFTDEDLFDNYSLQKPGRSFSVKVRYFIR